MHTTAIEGATALVGAGLDALRDAVIVVEGESIALVGSRQEVEVPPGAAPVDARGLLIIPGFIDAHVHIGLASPIDVLRGGVTTARDLAWPPDVIFPLADRSAAASFDGPTILAAGPMLTAPGGYPTRAAWAPDGTGLAVRSPDHARESVERLARSGAAVIKIALNPGVGPVLESAHLQAIVDAAHDLDLKVTGHISGLEHLETALAAGIDELAHMLMSSERIPDQTLQRMVDARVVIVPTLSVRFGADRSLAIENLARFLELGGKAIYGTDLGNEGPRPGIDPLEVAAMAAAGMTARDIIAGATGESAAWLGLERVGVIAQGADADLVAVPPRALEDPTALTNVQMVWRRGRRVR